MKAYQFTRWGQPLEESEVEIPKPKGTEVLLKVTACGVCHSDIHIWDGFFDLGGGKKVTLEDRGLKLPFTLTRVCFLFCSNTHTLDSGKFL